MPNQFAYSRQFFDRYYRPDNTICSWSATSRPDKVMPLIEQHYGAWSAGPAAAVPVEPPQTHEQRATVPWKGASLPMLLIGFHMPAFSPTGPSPCCPR
jgi:zinc protease